ncbi:ferric reductase-like transmembrane domain-containing protein [Allomuricauda sp. SCSIO 65647]|uniref:ferredoxin reductase family protein n=1 Tax=Allomuricauda sp. SCSIO 65647 TaxID=2908843 RepID=UPI001F16261F|nr:ferredoxin reductase family protein [Muricauda sp. SCSIO 65647]UJH68837.1 ferredoxin reductase family protein [Muricauda sp. SCSIO 65647]
MRHLKQEIYFPIIVGIHFIFWAIDLYFYEGSFKETSSDTMFFGELTNVSWKNPHRILGEVFSSWVVTVFAFNFLMATRARWVENLFGGLDKMYLIHRRSGIIAVFLLLAHFVVVPRAAEFNPGKPLGFYALILILIGVLLSAAPIFKRKIPYHKWVNFHKLMGIFYVMGVIHGILVDSLIKELPITRVYVFGMAFIGIMAWFYRAFLFRAFNKKMDYTVTSVQDLGSDIVEIEMVPENKKLAFKAGQFAFFTFPAISKREQHPFTISSHPNEDNLKVTIKGLGDYTNGLADKLSIGDKAKVEGPYGKFSTAYSKEREQVWVAGGIGITPFLSLIKDYYTQKVTLFWCVSDENEAPFEHELKIAAEKNPLLEFVLWESKKRGHINVDDMSIRKPKEKSYFICGPEALKKNIAKQLRLEGVKQQHIHDEEFAFR